MRMVRGAGVSLQMLRLTYPERNVSDEIEDCDDDQKHPADRLEWLGNREHLDQIAEQPKNYDGDDKTYE